MAESMEVLSRGLVAPVTSLLFHKGFLMAGEGPNLLLYEVQATTKSLCCVLQVFRASRIYGIKPREDGMLCIFGGKSCRLVHIKDGRLQCASDEQEFPDWVWDVTWLRDDKSDVSGWTIALALGHNWVIRYDWQSGTTLISVHCQEKCILYSALFLGSTWASLVLAAGTVFNQVVLWTVDGERDETGRLCVLHRLYGHKGVIFSMAYQPNLRVFCSVSDDRSIQLWQVTWPASSCRPGAWSEAEFQLIHTLYGHTARVWDIRLGAQCLVSVGEDATCCIWNYEGQVLKKLKGHKGKGIWSLDIDEDRGLVATGGEDGGIFIWELSAGEDRQNEVNSRTLPPPQSPEIFFPRTIKLLSHDVLLVMSDDGSLHRYNIPSASWELVFSDSSFRSYSIMEPNPEAEALALGNIGGQLRILWNGLQTDVSAYSGKVFSLCWLTDPTSHSTLLLTTGPDGCMILWCVELTPAGISVEKTTQFTLPTSKQRWVSCADMIPDSCLLVCGDRVGSIHAFDMQQQGEPIQSLWKLHGKAGVTDICYHGDHVYSCGRDGQYREFDVLDNQLELLHSNRVCKGFDWLARMTFQQGDLTVLGFHTNDFVVYSPSSQQRLLTVSCGGGHRGWDMRLPDGEGTATFVYIKTREVVVCEMQIRQTGTVLKPGLHGRDIMDIRYLWTENTAQGVCHVCASCSEDTQVNLLRITDAVDLDNVFKVTPLFPIAAHISSIRTLSTSLCPTSSDTSSHLVFSGGGRSQMKCVKVTQKCQGPKGFTDDTNLADGTSGNNSQNVPLATKCDQSDCDKVSDNQGIQYEHLGGHMLHSKGRHKRKSWKFHDFDSNPETRFMDMSSLSVMEWTGRQEHKRLHLVCCACSDATVRIFCFEETTHQFHLLCHTTSLEHCMLKITHLTLLSRLVVMATGTDGCVVLWDVSDIINSFLSHLHPDLGSNQADQLDSSAAAEPMQSFEFNEDEYFTLSDLAEVLDGDSETNNATTSPTAVGANPGDHDTPKDSVMEDCQATSQDSVDSSSVVPSDGHWESQPLRLPQLTLAVHQSGINALDWIRTEDGHVLIATGGDDNALCVSDLQVSSANQKPALSLVRSLSEASAHGTQITGARFLSPSHVITVSIDQRLIVWRLDWHQEQLCQEFCQYVHVSDVSNLEVWRSQSSWVVAICGMGLELLSLADRDSTLEHQDICQSKT